MIYVNFVCTGNTCRSPMAEAILKNELKKRELNKNIRVKSSGLYAEIDAPMSENSKLALKSINVPFTKHRAKQFTPDKKCIVITMTNAHKAALPESVNAVSISELTGGREVDDPYGKSLSAYIATAEYLQYAADDIIAYILNKTQDNKQL